MQRELTLHELLTEPIVRQLMNGVGVMTSYILKLFRPKQSDGESIAAHIFCEAI